jgi:hypothetical protein
MATLPWIQYPTLQEPVLTDAQRPEQVTESRWHQPWSEPVRFKINKQLAIALAASGLFFVPQQAGEVIFVDKWINHWREPVRFKGVFRGMPTGEQPAAFPSPQPFVPFGWFDKLSEPIVKQKVGLRAGSQRFQTGSPLPFVSFSWFRPQTELPPKPKIGLATRFQQFLAQPPRLLPTPTITGRLNAIESGDTALFVGVSFGRPVNAMIGVIELAQVPYLGIIEMPLTQGVSGVIEDHVAPASGSAAPVISDAAVSIRII